jgi:hypothetical protein
METLFQPRIGRGRGAGPSADAESGRRLGRNKQWIADHIVPRTTNVTPDNSDGERRQRGGYRGGRARGATHGGRRFPNVTLNRAQHDGGVQSVEHLGDGTVGVDSSVASDPELETPEAREKFYQEVCCPNVVPQLR